MTIYNQVLEDYKQAFNIVYNDYMSKTLFTIVKPYVSDKKTSTLISQLLMDEEIWLFWNDLFAKRGRAPCVVGLSGQECKVKGISKGFTTVKRNPKSNEKMHVIYYDTSLSDVDSKIYIIMELMNLFNWEKYENNMELAKKGEVSKKKFAYLCEANEWQNLHLASNMIFRVAPHLRKTSFEAMVKDFDVYSRAQKKSGHTRKYIIQYHVLRAAGLFKRALRRNIRK